MRAVNLIPAEGGRGPRGAKVGAVGPVHVLIGLLAVAVAFVTIYVLSANTVSQRKSQVATLQAQATQAQAQAARLGGYAQFEKLAQTRAETVREIAATRFDWHGALSELSRVVPSNTSLQSLLGTVAPGATVTGAGGNAGASTGSLRGAITAPAFELKGCTSSHDDVARLMSRLRLINGVNRVTLADSQKPDSAQTAPSTTAVAGSASPVGCGADHPSFDLVVFFQTLPGAGPSGVASLSTQPVSTTTAGGSK